MSSFCRDDYEELFALMKKLHNTTFIGNALQKRIKAMAIRTENVIGQQEHKPATEWPK